MHLPSSGTLPIDLGMGIGREKTIVCKDRLPGEKTKRSATSRENGRTVLLRAVLFPSFWQRSTGAKPLQEQNAHLSPSSLIPLPTNMFRPLFAHLHPHQTILF